MQASNLYRRLVETKLRFTNTMFACLMSIANNIRIFFISHRRLLLTEAKKAISWSILLGILIQFDPFGISSATAIQGEKIFSRFTSQWYPSDAQKEITVVLIDKIKGIWPPDYDTQAHWLKTILDRKPKAVFVDLTYKQKHGEPKALIDIASQSNIPVYFPFPLNSDKTFCDSDTPFKESDIWNEEAIIKEIRNTQNDNKTFIGWSGCGNRYPLYFSVQKNSKETEFLTPAMTMFKKYCKDKDNEKKKTCMGIADIKKNYAAPMAVAWGSKTKAEIQDLLICEKPPNFLDHLFQLPADIFKSLSERGIRSTCPFTDTVPISKLLMNSGQEDLDAYIKDRYVFVGAAIKFNNDYIINPINGKIPGVYLLAMAFDNLVNFGNEYYHELDPKTKTIGTIVILFCVIFSLEMFNEKLKIHGMNHFIRLILIKFFLPITWGFILACSSWKMKIAPGDWLGMALIAFSINPVRLSEFFEEQIGLLTWIRKFYVH